MKRSLLILSFAIYSSACTVTSQQTVLDPSAFTDKQYSHKSGKSHASKSTNQRWWLQLGEPVINQLVDEAIKNNLDLQVAVANIKESNALARSAFGSRMPQLDLGVSGERAFTGNNTGSSFNAGNDRIYRTTQIAAASISWQADLFGKLKGQERAAASEWQATQTDYEAALHSVIADVIRQRVQLAISLQRLDVARSILANYEDTLKSVKRRYRKGINQASAIDLRLARVNVYATQATITALEQDAAIAQHALDILVGRTPGALSVTAHELKALAPLDTSVVGTPVQLLDRRPDLRSAKFRSMADQARVSVALAELYPDLVITADIGWRDDKFSELFNPLSLFGRLLGQLIQPLYNGGRLSAEADAAKARYEAEAARYTQTVLTAIREVEDALVRNDKLHQRLAQIKNQLHEARQAQILSNRRYQKGLDSLLTVLEAQRRRQDAEDRLLQTTLEYWNARIDLYLATGGSWLDPAHLTVTKPDEPTL